LFSAASGHESKDLQRLFIEFVEGVRLGYRKMTRKGSPMTYQSSTWFLPRLIGLRRAKELILLNRLLSADEAMGLGLVNRVVAPEELSANPRGQLLDVYLG
jgi:enoyl-CoA hydratase/carnithine racemase